MLTREKIVEIITEELRQRGAQDRMVEPHIMVNSMADRIWYEVDVITLPHSKEQAEGMLRVASHFLEN